jgi:uncharacterized membrane protein
MKMLMRFLIAILAIAGIVDSALALRIHYEDPAKAPPCAVTEKFDCGAVNHSRFSVFPPTSFDEEPGSKKVHIPVAIFGIIGYGLIALFAVFNRLWITLQLTQIGFAFAAFLTYLEAYVMQKWCIYCVYSMGIVSTILVLTIIAIVIQKSRRTTDFLGS